MDQVQHYDVAVVGAGPAGLSAAAALRVATKGQKSVHVFEKTAMTARGAAILVGVNGLKALQAIDPQLLAGLLAKATKLEGSDRYNMITGEHIEFMAMRNDMFQEKYGFHNALLGWSDITGALKAALPQGSISTGCPVTAYKQQEDGTIQLLGPAASSSSGASDTEVVATCNILIGTDGWFSPIRQQVLQDGPPTFKDAVVFRARIPKPDFMPEQRTKWWVPPTGPNSADSLAVFIPLPGGDMVWQCHCPVAVMREKGLQYDPVIGEASSSHASNQQSSSSSSAKERCLKAFESFPAVFREVVEATPEAAITEHGLYQRTLEQIPDGCWGAGNVTLVGDAAHAAYVDGTGLALSVEDAAVLGWHIQQQGLTAAALRAYEAERIPRVKAVFGLTAKQAAAMKAGVPQRQLLDERAELLYGQAHFKPLQPVAAVAP
ncbi:hypothetical protein OEZ86_003819 [Tetradesmus obliquus]|nr:hypothetical protein OEZ86_003819 [Tetradesmus obliquus]